MIIKLLQTKKSYVIIANKWQENYYVLNNNKQNKNDKANKMCVVS